MKSEPTTQTAADEDTIRAIHRRMIDAWNAGDSAAFAAPFTDRADFVAWEWDAFAGTAGNRGVPSADLRYGREGSRLEGDVKFVHFLAPALAVMQGIGP